MDVNGMVVFTKCISIACGGSMPVSYTHLHINRLAARALAAGKTPIVWDDMLRSFSDEELELLDKRVVVMIWLYYESNYALAVKLARRFKQAGFTVLGAAAAKCGEGPEPQYLDMPWYELRLGNVDMLSLIHI